MCETFDKYGGARRQNREKGRIKNTPEGCKRLFGFGCWKDKSLSSTLAWKIPWTEEPGRLQSMGSRRVGHN